MKEFTFVTCFCSLFFLLYELTAALETHFLYKSDPSGSKLFLVIIRLLRYISFIFSIPFLLSHEAIHSIQSHYLWKRISKKIKTAYKVGITDSYYLHRSDSERRLNARRYYIPENEEYFEYHFGLRDDHEESLYWQWKRNLLDEAEMSEDELK